MLVTCPECGARYDIDGSLIPSGGRRVQCSACNHVWQQDGGAADDGAATIPDAEEETPREPPPLADEVKSILREEAERESRVRRERGLVEVQPQHAPRAGSTAGRHRPRGSSGPLPDAEAINATLRAASDRAAEARRPQRRRPGRGGFVWGLVVGLVLVGLAAAVYVAAPRVAEAVPQAAPALDRYVAMIDDLRVTLDRTAARATAALAGLMSPDG